MRILVAHAFYRISGGEDRYVEQLVDLLAADHDVELFRAANRELKSPRQAAKRMLVPKQMAHRLGAVADAFKPDLIHVHNVYPSLGAGPHLAARKRRTPLVMTVHNHRLRCPNGYAFTEGETCQRCVRGNHAHALLHDCFPSKQQAAGYATALWIDRFPRRINSAVTRYIAPSRYMAERLREWRIDTPVDVVRNFTDERPQGAHSEDVGFYAGRLSSEKGLDLLLLALMQAGDPPFEIVGEGPLLEPLKAMSVELRLQNVRFLGRVGRSEIDEMLERARYFVMPSLSHENAPLAVFEAMSAGVPALVTDRGGLPELDQLVVPAKDVSAMATAIRRLREDDELHAQLAAQGRRFAAEHLSPGVHIARLETSYEAAVSTR